MSVGHVVNPRALVALIASDPEALAALRGLVSFDEPSADPPRGPYMTPDEAAAFLRCDRKRIYDLASSGRLGRYREGRRLLLMRSEVEAIPTRDSP